MTIGKFKKNRLGTTDFEGKFDGMRKPQEFITYAIGANSSKARVQFQSDTRIGYICLETGRVDLSPSIKGGAYNHHLSSVARVGKLEAEELLMLKAHIFGTASKEAGTSGVTVDNSGASEVFSAGR